MPVSDIVLAHFVMDPGLLYTGSSVLMNIIMTGISLGWHL